MAPGLVNRAALGFASAGLAISASLTLAHLSNTPLPCGGGSGCEDVAHDPSSQWFGVPVAAFGILGYLALILCALLAIKGVRNGVTAGLVASIVGLIASIGLTYHSVTVIHATCIWCLSSAGVMAGCCLCFALMSATQRGAQAVKSGIPQIVPWIALPMLAVAAVAYLGDKTRVYKIDLAKVSFNDLSATSHALGNPNARIVIAEFGDLMCPACRQMQPHVLKFQAKFPDKVAILFHHFPMSSEPGHELSEYAAELSDRLNSAGFWKFVDSVYGSENKPDKDALDAIFASCPKPIATEADAKKSVSAAIEAAKQCGVKLTPTYILFIDKKPDAFATNLDLANVLSRPEFKAILEPKSKHP